MRSGRGAPVRGHSPRLPGFPADKLCPFGTLLPWAFPLPGLRTPRPRPPLRRAGRVSSPGPAIDRGIPLPVPAAHELGRRFPRHLLFSGLTARCLDHSGILFPRLSRSVYLPEVRHRSRSFDRPRVDPIFSAQTSRSEESLRKGFERGNHQARSAVQNALRLVVLTASSGPTRVKSMWCETSEKIPQR
jgi:hypothetical protein